MKISTGEGTVYGRTYYCVGPWFGGDHPPPWPEMEQWVVETMGPSTTSIWGGSPPKRGERWYANNGKFWFRDEQDRSLFILRWS
jgi:hypothetical protein